MLTFFELPKPTPNIWMDGMNTANWKQRAMMIGPSIINLGTSRFFELCDIAIGKV
jgi:hypothetical protein